MMLSHSACKIKPVDQRKTIKNQRDFGFQLAIQKRKRPVHEKVQRLKKSVVKIKMLSC